jgi:hypothetical protein
MLLEMHNHLLHEHLCLQDHITIELTINDYYNMPDEKQNYSLHVYQHLLDHITIVQLINDHSRIIFRKYDLN